MIAAKMARRATSATRRSTGSRENPMANEPRKSGAVPKGRPDLENAVTARALSETRHRRDRNGLGTESPGEEAADEGSVGGVENPPFGIADHHIAHQILISIEDLRDAVVDVLRIVDMTEFFLDQRVGDQNSHGVGDASAALVDGLVL